MSSKTIYIVYSGTYDDIFVDQIFSTRELAEQYISLTDEAIEHDTMPYWSFVTDDLTPHLRIVEAKIDQIVPMMESRKTIYIGHMHIDGAVTFLYQRFNEIKGWNGNVYHIIAVYRDKTGKYREYYIDSEWEQGTPQNYLLFKVMADSQESAIDIVNTKRLELIDKGIFLKEVTENIIYIGKEL